MTSEVKNIGDGIIRAHEGQTFFNMTEARKIIGCGENTITALIHSHGITVKKVGPSKRISAYEIAEIMCSKKVCTVTAVEPVNHGRVITLAVAHSLAPNPPTRAHGGVCHG